ncbi:Zeaxanthin epoxidase, chloroplastic [Cadophora sp. M221]|nr:Zeaxanthin epoxidase, chloroplastic [Cadophora sp. M221]
MNHYHTLKSMMMASESFVVPSILMAGGTIAFILVVALTSRIVQARFLHPLRQFPGPFFSSISDIPAAMILLRANQPMAHRKLHEKYGPIVRVAPNELSFIGADAWEGIYGFQKTGPNFEKSPIFIGAVSPVEGQMGISLAPNEPHSRQRKALAAAFTNNALLQQQVILQRHVDKLMMALKKMAADKQSVNMADWYTFTTFDMIGDICFAEPFGCLDDGAANEWAKAIVNIFKSAVWDQAMRRLAGTGSLLHKVLVKLVVPAEAAKWRVTHFSKSKEKTLRRLADPDRQHPDLIQHILKNEGSRKGLTQTEIVLNMVLFISAGSETTANLMTGWTYFMISHPHILQRVTDEVRAAFSSDRDIKWETVKDLSYLEATMHEALRLFSPAPANQQRVVPVGGAMIDGHFIPAGTTVAVAPFAAVRSPLNFVDGEKFAPERWLGDKHYASDNLHASQPFSLGPRGCIGKNLSFFEMRLILTHLLWNFDLALAEGKVSSHCKKRWDETDMECYQTWMKPDLWASLKEVKR